MCSDPAFFRPVDAVEFVGDASRARDELGWAPTVGFEWSAGRSSTAWGESAGVSINPTAGM